jgi:hypothetical protein
MLRNHDPRNKPNAMPDALNMTTCIRLFRIVLPGLIGTTGVSAQDVGITVYSTRHKKVISPNIYRRNNTFDKPSSIYRDTGLRFVRMNAGNNATKYNWHRKITSHPDWYNNVYAT